MRIEEVRIGMLIRTFGDMPVFMTRARVEVVGEDYVVVRDCGLCPGNEEAYLVRKRDLGDFVNFKDEAQA